MRCAFVLALCLGWTAASASWAQPQQAPAAAPRAGEGVDYLIGDWLASAQDPATGKTMSIDYKVERLPGGTWLAGSGLSSDQSLKSRDIWGRDPLTREIMRLVFDSSGAFAVVRSPGWAGDKLVLEGDVRSEGGVVRVRESITRLGPDRFRAVWEAYRNGAWVAYSIETLTRRS
jgi:hypothetical protein